MDSTADVQTITIEGSDKETVITIQGSPSCHYTHSLDRLDMNLLLWVPCNHFLLQNCVQIQADLPWLTVVQAGASEHKWNCCLCELLLLLSLVFISILKVVYLCAASMYKVETWS